MSANPLDTWRVMTPEGIFETDLHTLRQWIVEGCVLKTDKVARGHLNWIDAGREIALRRAFAGELGAPNASPQTASVSSSSQVASVSSSQTASVVGVEPAWPAHVPADNSYASEAANSYMNEAANYHASEAAMPPFSPPVYTHNAAGLQHAVCHNHPHLPPQHICRACNATFCRNCPNFVNKIPLCTLCGDLCKPFQEIKEKAVRRQFQTAGFGFAEFGQALAYPFRNIFSLLFMSVLYAFLLFAGFKGRLVGFGILFGCMSHVISQFAWGRTDRGILPDFDTFSWWDSIIRPLFLSIGISIITFGPMIALILALIFGVINGAKPAPFNPAQVQQAEQQKESELSEEDMNALINGTDPAKEAVAAKKVEQLHPAQRINKEMERQKEPAVSPASMLSVLGIGGLFIFLFLLALAWAIFYYPMALAVAGYTEDIKSVINPLVGLDTMRRMGWTYVKAFLMYLSVQVVGFGLSIVVAIVLAPFDMPFFGNLPASFIDGIVTFYTSLVIACILGFALFKCADKLDIQTD